MLRDMYGYRVLISEGGCDAGFVFIGVHGERGREERWERVGVWDGDGDDFSLLGLSGTRSMM